MNIIFFNTGALGDYLIQSSIINELKKKNNCKLIAVCSVYNSKIISNEEHIDEVILYDKNWNFFQSRDDNFKFIKSKIENLIDVLFIDTLHEADHVEKLIYGYFDIIKIDGYLFIDDISHLPYQKTSNRNNFYCEINNHETFQRILEIYNNNQDNLELEFCFISSGLAIFKKKKNFLNKKEKIISRNFTIKNITRCIIKNFLKKNF